MNPDPALRDQENVPLPHEPVTFEPDAAERLGTEPYRRAIRQSMYPAHCASAARARLLVLAAR